LRPIVISSFLRGRDRGISRFPGHRGLREKFRAEVLHRDRIVVGHHAHGPFTGRVLTLAGDLRVRFRGLVFGFAVS
jgi:hypothetical protein